jgi:hypothetical protein
MSFFNVLSGMFRRPAVYRHAPRRSQSAVPLCLETLEGRCLLSSFVWENPWGVSFLKYASGAPVSYAIANFGDSATGNGQITDTGSAGDTGLATAVARAYVYANPRDTDADDRADVYFWRTFQLVDSPGGWTGAIDAVVTGDCGANGRADAFLRAEARIVVGAYDAYSSTAQGILAAGFSTGPMWEHINVANGQQGNLSDGTYTVMGIVSATCYAEAEGNGDSSAAGSVLVVNVDATPQPGPATHLTVSAPAAVTAGTPFSVTVTALDADSQTATGYRGTVHFSSSDGQAVLPGDYTFTSGDAGVHTFTSGVTLKTACDQTVTATDTGTGTITGSGAITINPAAIDHLRITSARTVTAGMPFDLIVTAQDRYGNTVTSYTGTVTFSTSDQDPQVTVPANYTFTAADNGTHTFSGGATLYTTGDQTITVTDTLDNTLTGTLTVTL